MSDLDPKLAAYRAKKRRQYAERKAADPRQQMLASARHRAKRDGYVCTISKEDIVVPELCPVLGLPLRPSLLEKSDSSPSLDKLIPELGYVPGNVRVISWRANRLKSDASLAELEALVAYMKGTTHGSR